MSKITFAEDAWNEYLYWQFHDKKILKKINSLLKSIQREPFTGEGKPEHLRNTVNWSRRINEKDRLVYEVSDGMIIVKQCKGIIMISENMPNAKKEGRMTFFFNA